MNKLFTFIFLALFSSSFSPISDCDCDELISSCIPKLSQGYNYLKDFKIDGQSGSKDKVEYSYVFTKGTQYFVNLCAVGNSTDGIVVSLYDSNRRKVATSNANGTFVSAISYSCNATGIYYIQYTFDKSNSYCGGSALGFRRN